MEKTWCQPLISATEYRLRGDYAYRTALWQLKEALVNAPTGAWTLEASGNTLVAGLYDTWTSWADVRFQYYMEGTYINPGSWVVLRSPVGTKGPYWLVLQHSIQTYGSYPSRIWITKSAPDLSQPVPHRLPPMTGPAILASAIMGSGGSGAPNDIGQTDCVVADDGSFVWFTRQVLLNGADNFAHTYIIFNIMDETPAYDTFGAFVFATEYTLSTTYQNTTIFTTEGRGMDPDGTVTTLAMVRKYPRDGASAYTELGICSGMVEDPLWNKYASEPIHVFCTNSGRQGYRGRLVDIYWMPKQMTQGVVAFRDFNLHTCSQAFWVPTPTMPWRIG